MTAKFTSWMVNFSVYVEGSRTLYYVATNSKMVQAIGHVYGHVAYCTVNRSSFLFFWLCRTYLLFHTFVSILFYCCK